MIENVWHQNGIKYLVSEMIFFICPAVVAILDFRWTKTKLFKKVKYHIFLQITYSKSEIQDDHEDKFNIGPNRKNISQLILSEAVEAFVGTFGCALGGNNSHCLHDRLLKVHSCQTIH
jgi:hypothetical protein